MTNTRADIASDTDLLCETCGYTLRGLPPEARCPECGRPIEESNPSHRHPAIWEQNSTWFSSPYRFFRTTFDVLFRTTAFYRTLATRQTRDRAARFASIHWIIVSLLFGTAAYFHLFWFLMMGSLPATWYRWNQPGTVIIFLSAITYLLLFGLTRIAARLTSWEAGYRGYRLPFPVVMRGLDFHAAHYLPVGIISAATVAGYRLYLHHHPGLNGRYDMIYLYVLCGEVVLAAVYLFWTYWIGMRNMMYANA